MSKLEEVTAINRNLEEVDPEMAEVLIEELQRQQFCLVMIPSENYASKAVMQAQGCIMTNKYAEGYPGNRWYNGCQFVDMAEILAIQRAKKIFGADHANVQLHTGSQANMAVYYALLEPGDTIMGMSVEHGGHLTHGRKVNFSGRYYQAVPYGVDRKDERINFQEVRKIVRECRPRLIVTGASAYPRQIDFARFREIADEVGAYLMADIAHIVGLIAAKLHPDPIPYCDVVTSTTHKTLRGPRGAFIMCKKEYQEMIDRAVFPGIQAGPLMHVIAAKAVAFKEAMMPSFQSYQAQIIRNAQVLADVLISEGFRLVTGGTDNHLVLIDLTAKGLTGQQAANLLEEAGIIVNKNTIPFDSQPPQLTSGIRPGTPALTTRGMKEPEMKIIGKMLSRVIHHPDEPKIRNEVREEVRELCAQFPIYQGL